MRIQSIDPGLNTPILNKKQNKLQSRPSFQRQWSEHASWGANYIKENGKTNFKLFSFPNAKAVFVEIADKTVVGLSGIKDRVVKVLGLGVATAGASVVAEPVDEKSEIYPMTNKGKGVFEAENIDAKPGDNYRFIVVTEGVESNNKLAYVVQEGQKMPIEGDDYFSTPETPIKSDKDTRYIASVNNSGYNIVKDPYTKEQKNINGWSTIYDTNNYEWQNTDWLSGKDSRRITRKPNEPLRGLERLIIDEVNIPTMTEEGTFESAKKRIDEIAERKIATAIELMPVENTFSKQWGYDGVDKFAVNSQLGTSAELKELIDYAHGKGLNVIMDMVPNHMGPDGDYLAQTGPYIKVAGEFGNKFNFEGLENRYVRDWMTNAALWWANEYKVDGIRLDLTKDVGSDYLLRQITLELNEHNPDVFIIAEDHRNKLHSVTNYYEKPDITHSEELNFIDMQVDYNSKSWGKTVPWSIGFDSEWDSEYKENLVNTALYPNAINLDKLEQFIKTSHYRVKYGYSHDEIGNYDGTRFIPKFLVNQLNLYYKVGGGRDDEKGQRAAHAAQKLSELIVSDNFENLSDDELKVAINKCGIKENISKKELIDSFMTALAKHRVIQGTVMTTPGPKMYFQGDDEADLSYFKFFREFSGDKYNREHSPEVVQTILKQKGYDTLEEIARPDCIIGRVEPNGLFKNMKTEMKTFHSDLVALLEKEPALQKGDIVATYKDNNHSVHIHHLKHNNNEILVIKNFGQGFHDNNYEYFGFPKHGQWQEVFSSDAKEYGGSGYTNAGRTDINNMNQKLALAPNSFLILKKIG